MGRFERARDCRFPGWPWWLWYARRVVAGDTCLVWSFWRMRWEEVVVSFQDEFRGAVFVSSGECVPWYRVRPWWWLPCKVYSFRVN